MVGFGPQTAAARPLHRRQLLQAAALGGLCHGLWGCTADSHVLRPPEAVWGRFGYSPGRFNKPRAIAVDRQDQLYIVDMTARVQVFTSSGKFLRQWSTPESANGRPTGISVDRDGNICVADTHYFRVLFYRPDGELLQAKTIGGTSGFGPGEFNFVTDVAQDSHGNYYIAEYGEYDRIQKFDRDGNFVLQWGSHGDQPGQFMRPQAVAVDERNFLWVADACNHRIQLFDPSEEPVRLVDLWGRAGGSPGELSYPYGICLEEGGTLLICEFGNDRVQRFTREGRGQAIWGGNGRRPGELHQPWSLAQDSSGRIHVLDSYNHRVQSFSL
jgi:DNA-binding beta-propeller fold protein YncE